SLVRVAIVSSILPIASLLRDSVIEAANAFAILAACLGSLSWAVIRRKPASVLSDSTEVEILLSRAPALFGSSPRSRAASLATPGVLGLVGVALTPGEPKEMVLGPLMFWGGPFMKVLAS